MIAGIKGRLIKKSEIAVTIDLGGLFYDIAISPSTYSYIDKYKIGDSLELVLYHYLNIDGNRARNVMIGFENELERDFFEKFISVSGIGPRAALRAFDRPVAIIAKAIEEGDAAFLKGLAGIGSQKAKQIIAHLQGKVGRFALIKSNIRKKEPLKDQIAQDAAQILKRLQYKGHEIEKMINRVLEEKPDIDNLEDFLNEIYRQKKVIS